MNFTTIETSPKIFWQTNELKVPRYLLSYCILISTFSKAVSKVSSGHKLKPANHNAPNQKTVIFLMGGRLKFWGKKPKKRRQFGTVASSSVAREERLLSRFWGFTSRHSCSCYNTTSGKHEFHCIQQNRTGDCCNANFIEHNILSLLLYHHISETL